MAEQENGIITKNAYLVKIRSFLRKLYIQKTSFPFLLVQGDQVLYFVSNKRERENIITV